MKFQLIKRNNDLLPYSKHDLDQYEKLKNNVVYMCDIKQANNPEFHRKIFAVADTVCNNLPEGHPLIGCDAYQLIKATEIELGFVNWIIKLNGEKYAEPESISFSNWDNVRREEFYSKALYIWSKMIGISPEDLENNSE